MDLSHFLALLFSCLAPPTVIVAGVWMGRRPLSLIIEDVRKLTPKGLRANFGERIAKLEREADPRNTLAVHSGSPVSSPTPDRELVARAAANPMLAVSTAWSEVDEAMMAALLRVRLARKGEDFPPYWRGGKIYRLNEGNYLDQETYEILIRLRILLDSAARGAEEVDYGGAIEYSQLARRMIQRLNSIEL